MVYRRRVYLPMGLPAWAWIRARTRALTKRHKRADAVPATCRVGPVLRAMWAVGCNEVACKSQLVAQVRLRRKAAKASHKRREREKRNSDLSVPGLRSLSDPRVAAPRRAYSAGAVVAAAKESVERQRHKACCISNQWQPSSTASCAMASRTL